MGKMMPKKIGEILLHAQVISQEQLQKALQEQQKTDERFGEVLIRLGFVDEQGVLQALSKQFGVLAADLETFKLEVELARERGDFFTNIFGLKLSIPVTKLFLKFNLSENVATSVMFATGMLGAILLSVNHFTIVLGFSLLMVSYIFDYVDGQLARFYGHSSLLGAVMDRFTHIFVEELSVVFLGCWLFRFYQHWLVLILTFILLFWSRFHIFLSQLPIMIYVCEFMSYPALERKIIRGNYLRILQAGKKRTAENAPRSRIREYLSTLRVSSYTFTFFTLALLITSIVDYLFVLSHLNVHLKLAVLAVFSVYYVITILDFSYTYLATNRIYHQVSALENNLKDKMNEDKL